VGLARKRALGEGERAAERARVIEGRAAGELLCLDTF